MNTDLPAPATSNVEPAAPVMPDIPVPLEQVSSTELADLRRQADKYRFLFKTIVTVTGILVGATVIVVLAALLTDM